MKRTRIALAISLVGLSIAGLSGCNLADSFKGKDSETGSVQNTPATEVDVFKVKESSVVLSFWLEGHIKAKRTVDIRPEINGQLEEVLFKEGGYVKKDDILFKIDDQLLQAEIASSEASLEQARATLSSSQREYNRSDRLRKANAVSEEQHERALTSLEIARADIKQSEANLKRQEVMLEYATIKAPFSGYVSRSYIDEGNLLTANQTASLVTIHDLDSVYIDVKMDSHRYLDMKKDFSEGSVIESNDVPVVVQLENGDIYSYKAKVLFSESEVDPSTGSYLVRFELENPNKLLMTGMHVRVQLAYGKDPSTIMIPVKAVQKMPNGGSQVMLVNEDNIVESRIIETKEMIDDKWRVTSGLQEGDTVIIAGLQKIRPGVEVQANEVNVGDE